MNHEDDQQNRGRIRQVRLDAKFKVIPGIFWDFAEEFIQVLTGIPTFKKLSSTLCANAPRLAAYFAGALLFFVEA